MTNSMFVFNVNRPQDVPDAPVVQAYVVKLPKLPIFRMN